VADPKACCNKTVFWVRLNSAEKAIFFVWRLPFYRQRADSCSFCGSVLTIRSFPVNCSLISSLPLCFLCGCPLSNCILILFGTFFPVGCGHFDFKHVAYWWPFPASCHLWMKEASLLFQSPGEQLRYGIGPN